MTRKFLYCALFTITVYVNSFHLEYASYIRGYGKVYFLGWKVKLIYIKCMNTMTNITFHSRIVATTPFLIDSPFLLISFKLVSARGSGELCWSNLVLCLLLSLFIYTFHIMDFFKTTPSILTKYDTKHPSRNWMLVKWRVILFFKRKWLRVIEDLLVL